MGKIIEELYDPKDINWDARERVEGLTNHNRDLGLNRTPQYSTHSKSGALFTLVAVGLFIATWYLFL